MAAAAAAQLKLRQRLAALAHVLSAALLLLDLQQEVQRLLLVRLQLLAVQLML
jgi:hypothetical protein